MRVVRNDFMYLVCVYVSFDANKYWTYMFVVGDKWFRPRYSLLLRIMMAKLPVHFFIMTEYCSSIWRKLGNEDEWKIYLALQSSVMEQLNASVHKNLKKVASCTCNKRNTNYSFRKYWTGREIEMLKIIKLTFF